MQRPIKVLVKRPGEKPVMETIDGDNYKEIQKLIGGSEVFTMMPTGHEGGIIAFADDEGLLHPEIKPNFFLTNILHTQLIKGSVVFARMGKAGETDGLTEEDVKEIEGRFREASGSGGLYVFRMFGG